MLLSGIREMEAPMSLLHDFSDWIITIDLHDRTYNLKAIIGHGLPFAYFTKGDKGKAFIRCENAEELYSDKESFVIRIENNLFAVFGPKGCNWQKKGNHYTSDLGGKNYWSVALLPSENTNGFNLSVFEKYKKHAYAFPQDSKVTWKYDEESALVSTTCEVTTQLMEENHEAVNTPLMCLLPHQWRHSPSNDYLFAYYTVKGKLKTVDNGKFSTEVKFNGVIPFLPFVHSKSKNFKREVLEKLIREYRSDTLKFRRTYYQGKDFHKYIQLVHIAEQVGDTLTRDNLLGQLKQVLQTWLSPEPARDKYFFYYNKDWGTMTAFPESHFQASLLNDHHFHWGYFIHSAILMETYFPGWAKDWGGLINLLIRDGASPERNDDMFPFLRMLDPYAGHSWANGLGDHERGNDQESGSESMSFNTALILWGEITNNKKIRDLGVFLYTTELTAIEEYWFDIYEQNLDDAYQYEATCRVWGSGYDFYTWWTEGYEEAYGINYIPIHGGSLYLGHHPEYIDRAFIDIANHLKGEPKVWMDVFWKVLAFSDPVGALNKFNNHPDYTPEAAESKAHTYHWLHALNILGRINTNITANTPIACVFTKNGINRYIAYNYSTSDKIIEFSDGTVMLVPPGEMKTVFGN